VLGPGRVIHQRRYAAWCLSPVGSPATSPQRNFTADGRIGDVMVRDYPRQGEGGAHVEIVTGLNPMRTTGAHETGAYEQANGWLQGATYDPANQSFSEANGNDVYILRPQRRIGE
jgi:hypothetical protein